MLTNLAIKYNAGMKELELRVKDSNPNLSDIERMYGYCLGIVAAMEIVDDPSKIEARDFVNRYLDYTGKRRTLKYWKSKIVFLYS